MPTWRNLRVRTLLEENQHHAILRRCAHLLEHGEFKSNISGRVAVSEVLEAYRKRADLNAANPENVDGFKQLVTALGDTDEDYLRLVTLKVDEEETVIFTDTALSRVIGALRLLRKAPRSPERQRQIEDIEFYEALGAEEGPEACRDSGCDRLRVSGSARCRDHLFEMVKGRPYDGRPKPS